MAGMRKFIGGVVSGGLVAGLSLVIVSQLTSPRVADTAVPASVEVIAQPGAVVADAPPLVETSQVATQESAVAVAGASEAGVTAPTATEEMVTEETGAPVALNVENIDAGPVIAAGEPDAEAKSDAVPEAAAEVVAALAPPPTLPLTEAPAQGTSVTDAAPDAPTNLPLAEAEASLEPPEQASLTAPGADVAPAASDLPPPPPLTPEEEAILADPAQLLLPAPDVAVVVPETARVAPQMPPVSPVVEAPDPVAVAVAPAPDPAPVVVAEPEPVVITTPEPEVLTVDGAPATLSPDGPLIEDGPSTLPATPRLIGTRDPGAKDGLPQIAEAPPVVAAAEETLPEISLDTGPAIGQFGMPFENPEAKPLFAILLIDTGEATLDRQATASLPFPVSIVIDPLSPEAEAHAALYRAGGKEVVMLATGIPDGATPADLEQTFQAHAAALPEAVAVIDSAEGAFQNDRPLSTQLVPILAAQGRGLLTWDRGLNAADQVARREGLPTAMVFRQIDAENEEVPVMRRYLDRAAFKAAQEGQAMVIGTIRAETLAALLEWMIEGRASTVAIAPVSAILDMN